MGALKTRLDGFLRVVELGEEAAQVAHAGAVRLLLAARVRRDELRNELRREGPARGLSQDWAVADLARHRIIEALRLQEHEVSRSEKAEQLKREELTAAHQKAESIRGAVGRLLGEQVRALTRREQREADEIALSLHRRAR